MALATKHGGLGLGGHLVAEVKRARAGGVVHARGLGAAAKDARLARPDEARGRLLHHGGVGLEVIVPGLVVCPGKLVGALGVTTGGAALASGGEVIGRNSHGALDAQREVGDGEAADHDAGHGQAHEQDHADDLPHEGEQHPRHPCAHVAAARDGHLGTEHVVGALRGARRQDGEHRERGEHHEGKPQGHAGHERAVGGQKHRHGEQDERHGNEQRALAEAEPQALGHGMREQRVARGDERDDHGDGHHDDGDANQVVGDGAELGRLGGAALGVLLLCV